MKAATMWLAVAMICFQVVTVIDGSGNLHLYTVTGSGGSAMVMDVDSGHSAYVNGLNTPLITVTPLDSGEAPTIINAPGGLSLGDSFNGAFKSDW